MLTIFGGPCKDRGERSFFVRFAIPRIGRSNGVCGALDIFRQLNHMAGL